MLRAIPPAGTYIGFGEILSSLFSSNQSIGEFKQKLCDYFRVKDCFLISSGRAALTLILNALKKLREGNEVIIPAYTCFSVPSAVARAGLKIRLCDISLDTLNLEQKKILPLINKNTLAVLPVHHFGISHDISGIIDICREQKVFIIEDVAQGMGAKFRDRHLGTLGDVSFFSLGRGKNITTLNGGIILSRDEEISALLKEELSHMQEKRGFEYFFKMLFYKIFLNPNLYWIPEKIPSLEIGESRFYPDFDISSLSSYQANLGCLLFQRLEEINQRRIENAHYLTSALMGVSGISFLPELPDAYSIYLRLPILFREPLNRESIYKVLKEKNLGASKMYPNSLDKIGKIEPYLALGHSDLSNSHLVERTLLTLPTHQLLRKADLNKIIEAIT